MAGGGLVGIIKAALDIDVSSVSKAMRDVKRQFKEAFGADTQRDIKNLGRNLQGASNHAKNMGSHLKSVERIVGGILISQAFYKMAGQISIAADALYDFMGEMDKAEIAFENFLDGNNDKAKAFMYNMQDFAAETAFDTAQANRLSMQLMAAQFDPTQIRSMMEVLNDAAAGSGAGTEAIDRIVYAMNQIKTKGKLMAEELRQLANANIPIYKILAEQLGIAEEKLTDIGELNIHGDLGVAALLQGLEKQYKGTAERMSNTLPGLIANIKDNLLVIGDALFEGPYNSAANFFRGIRERLDELREISANKGIGGVFVEVFGEDTTQKIRVVIAAVKEFVGSLKQLAVAFAPVAKAVGSMLLTALTSVLVPLSKIISFIANLVSAALDAVPGLRYLIAAIAGLTIAFAAGKALVFLWTITGAGLIASTVAKAVILLRNAIALLFTVVGKSKLLMALSLLATILMGVAVSSGKAAQWIDGLTKKLQNLMGISTEGILDVKDLNVADQADEFNKAYSSVKDIMDATKGSGDAADEAGKKYKKWLGSFDEVFQVPEPEDKDKDDILNIPDFDLGGGIGDIGLDDNPFDPEPIEIDIDTNWDPPDIEPWIKRVQKKIKDVTDDMKGRFQFEFSFAKSWQTVKEWAKSFKTAMGGYFKWAADGYTALGGVIAERTSAYGEWVKNGYAGVGGWIAEKTKSFGGWVADGYGGIAIAASEAWGTIKTSSSLMWKDMKGNFTESMTAIGDWFVETGEAISSTVSTVWGGAVDMAAVVGGWFANAWDGVTTAIGNGISAIGTFFKEHWDKLLIGLGVIVLGVVAVLMAPFAAVGTAVTGAATMIGMAITAAIAGLGLLIAPFWDEITAWFSGTWTALSGWASNFISTIGKWGTDAWNAVSGAFSNMWTSVSNWVTDTYTLIANWVTDTVTAIADWGVNMATTIYNAITDGLAYIGDFVTQGIASITGFVTGFATEVGKIAGHLWNAIVGLPATVKGIFSQFITIVSGVISSVLTFFKNLPGNIYSFIKSIPGTFSTLLGKLPGLAMEPINQFIGKFKDIPGKIWEHIKSIPSLFTDALKNIPGVSFLGKSVSLIGDGFKSLGNIAGFENGGIIGQDSIVRVGEKGKREAIIPLQNARAMQPFVDAIVAGIGSTGRPERSNNNSSEPQQILYVGNLIADDRSLRELERKMRVIRVDEDKRGAR